MENSDHFEQAKQIAAIAALLDSDKNEFPDEARVIATMCVDNMYALAEILVGNQASKIYLRSPEGHRLVINASRIPLGFGCI